jgi:hypothetical protein
MNIPKENELQTLTEAVGHELAPAVIERELANLQVELNPPLTAEAVDRWSGRIRDRKKLFSDTVWGKIRWPKSLGQPIAPTLANAFVIEHIHWQSIKIVEEGELRYVDIISPHQEPSKWDVPDEQYYQVSFMTEYAQGRGNRIRVHFSSQIAWEHLSQITHPGYRDIEPSERHFNQEEGLIVLDLFELMSRRYVRIEK